MSTTVISLVVGQTYQNHILFLSFYVACLAFLLPKAAGPLLQPPKNDADDDGDDESSSNFDDDGEAAGSYYYYFLTLLSLLFLLLLTYAEISYMILRRSMPPGSSGLPLVGDIPWLFQDPVEYLRQKLSLHDAGGGYFTLSFLSTPTLLVTRDEDVMWIVNQERKKRTTCGLPSWVIQLIGPKSVVAASGEYHFRLRRLLEPAFTRRAIKRYTALIDRVIQEQFTIWEEKSRSTSAAKDSSESSPWLSLDDCKEMAIEILFRNILPFIDTQTDKGRNLMKSLIEDCTILLKGPVTPFPFKIPGTVYYKGWKARLRLLNQLDTLVNDFTTQYPSDSHEGQTTLLGHLCYGRDPEAVAGSGKEGLTREELLDNLLVLVIAGFDTFAGTMSTIIYRLVTQPPTILQALREEAKTNLLQKKKEEEQDDTGDSNSLDFDTLKSDAPILNAFLAEMWRIDPPVFYKAALANEPLPFHKNNNQYIIPKGCTIAFSIADSAISCQRYLHPEEFHIERFLPTNHPLLIKTMKESATAKDDYHVEGFDINTPNGKNRTFSYGPHVCLGHEFARVEARIFVTRLLQRYDIVLNPKQQQQQGESGGVPLDKFPLRRWKPECRLQKRK